MTFPQQTAERYYVPPEPGDFRQGDIYRDVLHIMRSRPAFEVLRNWQAKSGRTQVFLHTEDKPPQDGFKWESKERVEAEGQLALGLVLTHDCEIENEDNKHHRLVGLVRPLDRLTPQEQEIIAQNRHYGRLYLPAWPEVGLPESYLDLRRITTLRGEALPAEHRITSLTDFGREVLQYAIIRYLTEMYRG